MQWNRNEQTICAISTPPGVGGLAVIRVSGPQALQISKKIIKKFQLVQSPESHRAYFSVLIDGENKKLDEAVATYFASGKSFTGEEVVEISCHGSRFITQQVLDLLVSYGAKIAEKGEFTYRAFMNGRLDLVQAESVLSLIESQSKSAARVALRQLDGHVSKQFAEIISDLIWCLAHIEASIDFIEQGIEVVDTRDLISRLKKITGQLGQLLESYRSGRLAREGVKIALIGEPNVGKSSLLNLLLRQDKAIVTPIAGTTRDVIEGETFYEGLKYVLSDTAGLRETSDQVEKIGIDRSLREAEGADLVALVLDTQNPDWDSVKKLTASLGQAKKVILLNKADLSSANQPVATPEIAVLSTSALHPENREKILNFWKNELGDLSFRDEAVLSSSRQFEQTLYAFEMISNSVAELEKNTGAEFVAMYLKEALISLQKILGQVYDDQIMDRIFKEFCLGK